MNIRDTCGENHEDLWYEAIRLVSLDQKATAPHLQSNLRIGHYCASKILELMESKGYIGKQDGLKTREVYYKITEEKVDNVVKQIIKLPSEIRNVTITGTIEV